MKVVKATRIGPPIVCPNCPRVISKEKLAVSDGFYRCESCRMGFLLLTEDPAVVRTEQCGTCPVCDRLVRIDLSGMVSSDHATVYTRYCRGVGRKALSPDHNPLILPTL